MSRPLVIFDIDGTLLDTAPDLLGALNAILKEEGLAEMDRTTMLGEFGMGAKAMISKGFQLAGRPLEPEALERLLGRFLSLYEQNIAVKTRPFPGAVAALDRLSRRGTDLAICSNKREHLVRPLLSGVGLLDRFAAVIGGDSLPFRKPEPGHLLGTISAAGARASESVMVGDSEADIQAARGAGIPVVAVSFGYSPRPVSLYSPDTIIDNFGELDTALAAICPAFGRLLG